LGTGGEKLTFVEASVYDSLKILQPGTYDLVYTGIGVLCWIPSVKQWAKVVSGLLKPGGRLFIREGHPMLWAVDEQKAGLSIEYPYFELEEPTIFDEEFTYVGTGGQKLKETKTASFNHGLGEIIQALLSEGLRVTGLIEHQSVPWNAVPGQMEEIGNGTCITCLMRDARMFPLIHAIGEFRLKDRPWRLPHSYTLQAMKE
jgi:SAM-dependent methyltransferase